MDNNEPIEQQEEFFDALESPEEIDKPISDKSIDLRNKPFDTVDSFSDDPILNDRMFKFSDAVKSFWSKADAFFGGKKRTEEILKLFKDQMQDKKILKSMGEIGQLVESGSVVGLIQSEIDVLSDLQKMSYSADGFSDLSLDHVKTFYSLFMKCMVHTIENDRTQAIKIANLENIFIPSFDRNRMVQMTDLFELSVNAKLNSIVNPLRVSLSKFKYMGKKGEGYRDLHKAIYCLVETLSLKNMQDNKKLSAESLSKIVLRLGNVATLKLLATKIQDILSKNEKGTVPYFLDILRIENMIGAIPHNVFLEAQQKSQEEGVSIEDLWDILKKHDLSLQTSFAMVFVEGAPKILGEVFSSFDVQCPIEEVLCYQ